MQRIPIAILCLGSTTGLVLGIGGTGGAALCSDTDGHLGIEAKGAV